MNSDGNLVLSMTSTPTTDTIVLKTRAMPTKNTKRAIDAATVPTKNAIRILHTATLPIIDIIRALRTAFVPSRAVIKTILLPATDQPARPWLLFTLLALPIMILRCYLAAGVPFETSDAFRNLGYAGKLFETGFHIYQTRGGDFPQEAWSPIWSQFSFPYPPFTLVFFATFAKLGLGLFFVKLALALCDFVSAVIFAKEVSVPVGILYLLVPVHAWFGTHEGQFEPLLAMLLTITAYSARNQRWYGAGLSWGLALQTKHFAVLLLPWLLGLMLTKTRTTHKPWQLLRRFTLGFITALLPFLAFYYQGLDSFTSAFATQSMHFNPFAWNPFRDHTWVPTPLLLWTALTSYLLLLVPAIFFLRGPAYRRSLWRALPFILAWCLFKSLNWCEWWYVMAATPLLLCLAEYRALVTLLMLLMTVQDGRALSQLLGPPTPPMESMEVHQMMEAVMWSASPQFSPPRSDDNR